VVLEKENSHELLYALIRYEKTPLASSKVTGHIGNGEGETKINNEREREGERERDFSLRQMSSRW
jgi:hypothetical protein